MHISENSLDDLIQRVYRKLLKKKSSVKASRGAFSEISGVLLTLKNPRARLSRTEKRGKLFSALGELLWYLAGSNELSFIAYYLPKYRDDSEDGISIYGGYGPRLFRNHGTNQVDAVLKLLREKPSSRRAVFQLFESRDILDPKRKEIPCTCNIQLLMRDDKLNMLTFMRSNDAYRGLSHDIFCFTMLQEIFARSLNVEIGTYKHFIGSLHLYEEDYEVAEAVNEGYQSTISMPPMPAGDPWPSIKSLLLYEVNIRSGLADDIKIKISGLDIASYWKDIALLIAIYRLMKPDSNATKTDMYRLKKQLTSNVYDLYILAQTRNLRSSMTTQMVQNEFSL